MIWYRHYTGGLQSTLRIWFNPSRTINLIKPIFSIGITTLNYIYLTFCLVFYPWFTLVSGSHLFSIFTLSSTFCLVNDISSFHFRWILWWKDFFSCHVFRKQPLVANVFVCLSPRHPLFLLALAKNALHGDSGLTKGGSSDLLLAVPQAPLLILHLLMLLLGVISQKTDMSAALRWADDRDPCISQTGTLLNLPVSSLQPCTFDGILLSVLSGLWQIVCKSICNIIQTNYSSNMLCFCFA